MTVVFSFQTPIVFRRSADGNFYPKKTRSSDQVYCTQEKWRSRCQRRVLKNELSAHPNQHAKDRKI